MTQTQKNPHLIIDASALPMAMNTSTLTREDWRLMLIALDWIHHRYAQHPENDGQSVWTSRHLQGFITLFQLHPRLIQAWVKDCPVLHEILHDSPLSKGIWQAFSRLSDKTHSVDRLPFFWRDKLYPLQRYLQHRSANLELLRFTGDRHAIVHSIGLPLSAEHADLCDVITVPDLSLLHLEDKTTPIPHFKAKVAQLQKQLGFLNESHRIITWDEETADRLMEAQPFITADLITVAPPCWLLEMPANLVKNKGEDGQSIIESAYQSFKRQHQFNDMEINKEESSEESMSIESQANRVIQEGLNALLDLGSQMGLNLPKNIDLEVLVASESIEDTDYKDDTTTKWNKHISSLFDSVETSTEETTKPIDFIITSLRDSEHEDFIGTLNLAFTAVFDSLSYLPNDEENPNGVEHLALHLKERNGDAVRSQAWRRAIILYATGQFESVFQIVQEHPLYPFVKDKILLMPSTPYNKAFLYPKALAFLVNPLGNTFYPTILEAMAYSLPIVAPRQLSLELLTQEAGFFFNVQHPTKLPSVLDKLSKADSKRTKHSHRNARQSAETHNWQRFGEQLWKAYQFN
jgi:glycosyltransferase involved in cell wall biosynthesis